MSKEPPLVIGIGYGRHMFEKGNHERERMISCAKEALHYHLVIFTLQADGFKNEQVSDNFSLHPTNAQSKLSMVFKASRIAAEIIKNNKGKQIIVTTQDPFEAGLVGYLIKLRFKVHLTVQEHADAFSLEHWRKETFGNGLRYPLGKFILRRADTVRVVAKRIENTMRELKVKADLTRLPVAIDLDHFEKELARGGSQPDKKEDEFWFLSVARFVPQKNLMLMVGAFMLAYQLNSNLRLRLVGYGPEQKKVEDYLKKRFPPESVERSPVVMETWSDSVPRLMQQSDAYLLTSNYEGWARVLVEAIVCDLPVVTTDVGCVGEVIFHEKNGLVVPVGDYSQLVHSMVRIATDKKLQEKLRTEIQKTDKRSLPGTDIDNYGKEWIKTLI